MRRSSVLYAILLIGLACVACTGQYQTQPSSSLQQLSCSSLKLWMINDPYYDPTRLTPPPTSSLSAVDKKTPEYLQLQEAFDIAPPFFKDLLCGLKGVYITANGSTYPSWG